MTTVSTILNCGHPPSEHTPMTTGYGMADGKTYCYECCAMRDRQSMILHGRTILYLSKSQRWVTNWPGSLAFEVSRLKTGRHNIAGKRYDVWFQGPDNLTWHGVQYGDMGQLLRCKRVK